MDDEPDLERICSVLLSQWVTVIAPMYHVPACHVVSLTPEGQIEQRTWADLDPDPEHQRGFMRYVSTLDSARKRLWYDE